MTFVPEYIYTEEPNGYREEEKKSDNVNERFRSNDVDVGEKHDQAGDPQKKE
jgi:hypothetical protein